MIPDTILNSLGVKSHNPIFNNPGFNRLVVVFIDNLGWKLYQNLFRQEIDSASIKHEEKLASLFPSTTAAHLSTFFFNQRPEVTGIFEWKYFDEHLDKGVFPILFSSDVNPERDSLIAEVDRNNYFPKSTIFSQLKKYGLNSKTLFSHEYAGSCFTRSVARDSQIIRYSNEVEFLEKLVGEDLDFNLLVAYYDRIDKISHIYGPNSDELVNEVKSFTQIMSQVISHYNRHNIPVILCADHGQVQVDPEACIYLDILMPDLVDSFNVTSTGTILNPGGSSRDLFLYIKPSQVDSVADRLSLLLKGRAEVLTITECVKRGLIEQPASEISNRWGNLVVIPTDNNTVWISYYKPRKFIGEHGGLSEVEREVPFVLYK